MLVRAIAGPATMARLCCIWMLRARELSIHLQILELSHLLPIFNRSPGRRLALINASACPRRAAMKQALANANHLSWAKFNKRSTLRLNVAFPSFAITVSPPKLFTEVDVMFM
jgi:hypothetical protein